MKNSAFRLTRLSVLVFLFGSMLWVSCQKEAKEEPQPTKKELLANKWKVSDVLEPGGTSVISLPIDEIQCLRDNIFTISADDTYSIDEGANVCDPSTAGTGTWALIENDSKIKFTPATGDPLILTLIDVTSTTLKFSYELTDIVLPGVYTIILQKQ